MIAARVCSSEWRTEEEGGHTVVKQGICLYMTRVMWRGWRNGEAAIGVIAWKVMDFCEQIFLAGSQMRVGR